MIKLYDFELSGSCYKIRLLMNILNVKYEKVNVDFVNKEHRTEKYLKLNPFGSIPIFEEWLAPGSEGIMNSAAARLVKILNYPLDLPSLQTKANATFKIMDAHLANRQFLAADHATIADIACFPYTAMAGEGGIDLKPYPNILKWIDRVKKVPGFIPMPGIPAAA